MTYGASDDFGFNVTQDQVHVRDLHATILHLLGFDHERLTHRVQGLDMRLTGVLPVAWYGKFLDSSRNAAKVMNPLAQAAKSETIDVD
jgi:hypothetical protein